MSQFATDFPATPLTAITASPPLEVIDTVPSNMPAAVGLKLTLMEASELEKVAGPEKPSEYVMVPDKSPAPVFEMPTVADEEEPICVAINEISLELTAIIGVKGSGSTVTSSK